MKTPPINSNSNRFPTRLDVVPPAALQALFTYAPDRELLLTVELVFHHFVRPPELKQLDRSQIVVDRSNEPAAVILRGARPRHLVLDPSRRALLNILIPGSGRVFSNGDPFARLQRYAASLGIRLTCRTAICSVIMHAWAAGMIAEQLRQKLGYRGQDLNAHMLHPGLPGEARRYWAATVSLDHARALPRHGTRSSRANNFSSLTLNQQCSTQI